MKITSVYFKKTENLNRMLARVDIIIDNNLRINNIKLLHNDKKIFVDFPAKKPDYPDIVPLNSDIRHYLEDTIIKKYIEFYGGKEKNETLL